MENFNLQSQNKNQVTQEQPGKGETSGEQAASQPLSPVCSRETRSSFSLGKLRKTRSRDTQLTPIPSRAETSALLAVTCHLLSGWTESK